MNLWKERVSVLEALAAGRGAGGRVALIPLVCPLDSPRRMKRELQAKRASELSGMNAELLISGCLH